MKWILGKEMKVDLVAFGAHPDDVELHAGGLIAKLAEEGKAVAIVDATEGELSTNGNVDTRRKECLKASSILNIQARANLEMPDGGLGGRLLELRDNIVAVLRACKPRLVLAPPLNSRHPDHSDLAKAVKEACFFSGVTKYLPELLGANRPEEIWHYHEVYSASPTHLIDVSSCFDQKVSAIEAYGSQFEIKEEAKKTFINSGFVSTIKNRCREWGRLKGVEWAEPYSAASPLLIRNTSDYFSG